MSKIRCQVLEEYKLIYINERIGKIQRKQQHEMTNKWLKKESVNMPELMVIIGFMKENNNIKFTRQFYYKLIFPQICIEENKFNVDGLLFLFEADMIQAYEEYLSWKKSIIELENMVLSKYFNNNIVLEYRYERQKHWFEFSIHEVPFGVLYGMDCASLKQIKEMKSDLKEFKKLSLFLNKDEGENISYLSIIYDAWERYLISRDKYNGFKDYLIKNMIEY
ncbi:MULTISPECIES: hypothetical protein [Clostridium]|nr:MULTISPECIES: hypothetical protein [Clostridium]KIL07383.1 hypothetical protein SR42_14485 [Clostridium botulinum]MBN1061993.1 hypothetical protein [Clostridium botulinum]MBY6810865.1 hypothetical protein [Clostridium botulinum]MBY6824333.1 hypothetical protein [Clostridium botulinum]MBY6834787.1 hypothetical protein [Clostridium botulinum]